VTQTGNPPQGAPGRTLQSLLLSEPGVNPDGTLAPWLGQFLTRLTQFVGPPGGSSGSSGGTNTLVDSIGTLTTSQLIQTGAGGADGATLQRLARVEAELDRLPLSPRNSSPHAVPPLPPFPQTGTSASSSLSITDGTHTVSPTTSILTIGATVSGSSPNGTITVASPGAALPDGPIYGDVGTFSVPAFSGFTIVSDGQGGATSVFGTIAGISALGFQAPFNNSSNWALLSYPNSGSFTLTALVEPQITDTQGAGLWIGDGTGKFTAMFDQPSTNELLVQNWNSTTSYAGPNLRGLANYTRGPRWWRIIFDSVAATYAFQTSQNGILWDGLGPPIAAGSLIIGAPTQIGWAMYVTGGNGNATLSGYLWHFLRAP
jgi:hypothetical protein